MQNNFFTSFSAVIKETINNINKSQVESPIKSQDKDEVNNLENNDINTKKSINSLFRNVFDIFTNNDPKELDIIYEPIEIYEPSRKLPNHTKQQNIDKIAGQDNQLSTNSSLRDPKISVSQNNEEWFQHYGDNGIIGNQFYSLEWVLDSHEKAFMETWKETLEFLKTNHKKLISRNIVVSNGHLFQFLKKNQIPIQRGYLTDTQKEELVKFSKNLLNRRTR